MQGRSDETLNRNGIRIGTSEIYSALDSISEIKDSMMIDLNLGLFHLNSFQFGLSPSQ